MLLQVVLCVVWQFLQVVLCVVSFHFKWGFGGVGGVTSSGVVVWGVSLQVVLWCMGVPLVWCGVWVCHFKWCVGVSLQVVCECVT